MNNYFPPEAYGELSQDIRKVLFSEQEIGDRIREMGQAISADYNGRYPLLIGVLKGVIPFMADLLRTITIPVEVEYMAVSSYSPESRDHGVVRLDKDVSVPLGGRHILFIEDVIDTGLTLNYLLKNLRSHEPASLVVCTLFEKPKRRLIHVPIKYKGFDLPDRFVVGYGLDHREKYRNLPFVGLLKPEAFHPEI